MAAFYPIIVWLLYVLFTGHCLKQYLRNAVENYDLKQLKILTVNASNVCLSCLLKGFTFVLES